MSEQAEDFIEANYHTKKGLRPDKLIEDKTGKQVSYGEIAEAYHQKLAAEDFRRYVEQRKEDLKHRPFEEGDTVTLKSGGAVMTVRDVYGMTGAYYCSCEWHSNDGKPMMMDYDIPMLIKSKNEDKEPLTQ